MKKKLAFISSIMILSGIFGFLYEVLFYYINDNFNCIYMRGMTFGPWIDIYVLGGLFIYLLCRKLTKKPLLVFLVSGLTCGALEYIAGALINNVFHFRAWDYNTEILNFGNINGYICLRSVLFFAMSGMFLMYVMIPFIKKLLDGKHSTLFENLFISLLVIFLLDEVYNILVKMNVGSLKSASYYYKKLGLKYWNS